MRSFSLRYGDATEAVTLPDAVAVEHVAPPPVPPPTLAEADLVARALAHPVGSPSLLERAHGARRVTVVVPDRTRPARLPTVLPPVLDVLSAAGVPRDGVRVLVGGGIHAPAPYDALLALVGADVAARVPVEAADADDAAQYVALAPDRAIPQPRVHRAVVEADLAVLLGVVAPHYLAGCSGGPKALVPGCADRPTVEAAHRLTLDATVAPDGSPRNRLGRPEGNPFRDTLLRIAQRVPTLFGLHLSIAGGRVVEATAGEVGASHEVAWRAHRAAFGVARPAPADLVVAGGGAPRDRDLLQAHKALVVAAEVARPGAPIVWLAQARDGAGHDELLRWCEAGRPDRHLAALRRSFHPYGLTAYALRWKASRHPVLVVSTMSADVLRPIGLSPFASAQAAVDHALAHHPVARAVVLPDAATTFFV